MTGPSPEGLLSMIMALFFVVAVIIAIAWVAKKFNLTPINNTHFKVISSMSLGGRERIVIVEIQGQQHAVGVTSQSVNHLFQLEQNITNNKSELTDGPLLNKINKIFGYQAPAAKPKE